MCRSWRQLGSKLGGVGFIFAPKLKGPGTTCQQEGALGTKNQTKIEPRPTQNRSNKLTKKHQKRSTEVDPKSVLEAVSGASWDLLGSSWPQGGPKSQPQRRASTEKPVRISPTLGPCHLPTNIRNLVFFSSLLVPPAPQAPGPTDGASRRQQTALRVVQQSRPVHSI